MLPSRPSLFAPHCCFCPAGLNRLDTQGNKPSVFLAIPILGQVTETFIHAHAARLPGVKVISGMPYPTRVSDATGDNSSGFLHRWFVQCAQNRVGLRLSKSLFRRLLSKHHGSAVVAEYGHYAAGLVNVCEELGVPLVAHFHGADAYANHLIDEHAYAKLFHYSAGIVVVSEHMGERLRRMGAPEEKLFLNRYGVDGSQFRQANVHESAPILVAVGRFVEKKAPHLTLSAFGRALAAFPGARLIMIGSGPLLGPCRSLAHALGIAPSVHFVGDQSHVEVAAYMAHARAFVQHSVRAANGDCEGTPVSVLEAQCAGLPVIATRHTGIPEVVCHGTTGLLCEEYDVRHMAANMLRILRDRELAATLGGAGRKRIIAHYSLDQSVERLARFIHTCLGFP